MFYTLLEILDKKFDFALVTAIQNESKLLENKNTTTIFGA